MLNTSLCYWKLKDWQNLKTCAKLVVDEDPLNAKGIYRLAVAMLNLEEYAEAVKTLQPAMAEDFGLSPKARKEFAALYKKCLKAKTDYRRSKDKMYAVMFEDEK